ncbi:XRE family transcriptional regulator [Ciceribacter sp. RN22]|uniref:XRE family transcriptional regulator n=1 Tax=Ciceribacter sp. RN22 TaxID=2954932 RepID=UPI002092D0BA|nr:XRE family transcriptional regulator [Ciceribacter sp. RN22]MCO6181122.1 XRE family transcriptional regulator [Ciceribacter sp. RN22]
MKALIKAGRTLLGLSQVQLCEIAGVPLITLRRIEGKPDHTGLVSEETVARVIAALEKQGIQFLAEGQISKGPGVAACGKPKTNLSARLAKTMGAE